MSYVLHLWREPLPASLAQAEALLADLRRQLVFEPDPRARALVEGIAARLPRGMTRKTTGTSRPTPSLRRR